MLAHNIWLQINTNLYGLHSVRAIRFVYFCWFVWFWLVFHFTVCMFLFLFFLIFFALSVSTFGISTSVFVWSGVELSTIEINEELNLILSMHLGSVNVFKYNKLNVRRARPSIHLSSIWKLLEVCWANEWVACALGLIFI